MKETNKDTDKKKASKQADKNIDLGAEIERLTQENQELRSGWQRTQADFDNARKRWHEELQNLGDVTRLTTLLEIAPVVDNFRRAFNHTDNTQALTKGVEQIYKQLEKIIADSGLVKIEATSKHFNPAEHEAISHVPSDSHPPDTVVEEVESGYKYKDKVIKPARVVVSKGKESEWAKLLVLILAQPTRL